jgi:mono/diheme cytochrome c family protein
MARKWWKWLLAGVVFLIGGLVARAEWIVSRSYADVPEPPIVADRSPEGVARGELIFHSVCFECHGGADGRATGKHLAEVPAFLGEMYSANLAHPTQGVRQLSDGKIARAIRHGVIADGRLSAAMSNFGAIGDADVAAILGYMRSSTPVFEPAGEAQPRSRMSLTGKLLVTYVMKLRVGGAPSGVAVPPKAPSVEYGRYMVEVLDCATCHTEGFGSDKMHDPNAFAGGFELTDPAGVKIWTKNITPDEATGIGRWSVDDFERAIARGQTPDGYLVRKPMPLFSRLDRTDVEAIYAYLRTVPKVVRSNTVGGSPLQKPSANDPPELLFVNLGCVTCHGPNGPHRDKLVNASGKSDDAVADWILDPQKTKPGAAMPSFQSVLTREQALGLARYAKSRAGQPRALAESFTAP